ncbi:MAG: DegV family protein [Bacillota bacterium]
MKVQLVTDSASDIPKEFVEKYNIEIVPLIITFGDCSYIDQVELDTNTFYKKMSVTKELPKTSQPTPHSFVEAFKRARQRGPVLCITLSSSLSGTYQSALLAKEMVDFEVEVIDSLNVSIGIGMQVIKACRLAEEGTSIGEIKKEILTYRDGMSTFLTLNNLENIVKGGRLSPWEGGIGQLLNIKPVMRVLTDGTISPAEKVRGRKRALSRLLQLVEETKKDVSKSTLGIGYSSYDKDELNYFLKEINNKFSPQEIILAQIGPVIGTHGGFGTLGIVI